MLDPLVIEDRERAVLASARRGGRGMPVASLGPRQRRRLFVRGPDGLAPAALWLTRDGLQVFGDPLDRVRRRMGHRSVETTFGEHDRAVPAGRSDHPVARAGQMGYQPGEPG